MAKPPTKAQMIKQGIDPKKADAIIKRRERRKLKTDAREKEKAAEMAADIYYAKSKVVVQPGQKSAKVLVKARDALQQAFEEIGGVDALIAFGRKYPKEFYTQLWAKIIPRESTLDVGENLEELLLELGKPKPPLHRAAGEIIDHMASHKEEEFLDSLKRIN